MKGLFITFEGTEGSGKTTIINQIRDCLMNHGYQVIQTREPGGGVIAEQIRNVILNVENTKMDRITEALLYAASRRQHLAEIVIPHLENGDIVLCDRYLDSSLAYQGYARGIGIDKVYDINQFATDGILPDLTIYIDVHPQIGLDRITKNHRDQNRLDLETKNFHELVYKGYQEVINRFKDRIVRVNGEQDINKVYENVKEIIFSFLERRHVSKS